MIAFPAAAALIALACAAFIGLDAFRRPRPERVIWAVAFMVFAMAASAEVLGATLGWSPLLARAYYLAGATLVVGILALGELYLLWPDRMPALAPGIALLVAAIAATAVWSAPVDASRLQEDGWRAIERGPFLIALAVSINAGGTLVLAGGALHSAFMLKATAGSRRRAGGCLLIAIGTVVVALGGTLTRFGRPEVLYLAMSAGIAVIFAGVLLTRRPARRKFPLQLSGDVTHDAKKVPPRARLRPVPLRPRASPFAASSGDALRYVTDNLLPLDDDAIADACRCWSATRIVGDVLTREQARQAWALRVSLPDAAKGRFDRLPLTTQAQLGELFLHVWSGDHETAGDDHRAGARRPLAILRPTITGEGEAP